MLCAEVRINKRMRKDFSDHFCHLKSVLVWTTFLVLMRCSICFSMLAIFCNFAYSPVALCPGKAKEPHSTSFRDYLKSLISPGFQPCGTFRLNVGALWVKTPKSHQRKLVDGSD